jgi:hypothetical protein
LQEAIRKRDLDSGRDRERQRETDKERQRQWDTQRDTDRETERERADNNNPEQPRVAQLVCYELNFNQVSI